MSRVKNHISILLFAASVFGLLLSTAHYHNEAMECLDHHKEQHYTENTVVCPVCTLTADRGYDAQPALDGSLEFEEIIVEIDELFFSQEPFVPLLGRAPPFLA